MTAILLSFLTSRFVHAQIELATVRGTVTDQQGAVVPQAVVTAREIATNLKRTSTTQQNGQYLLPNLPDGQYEGAASASWLLTRGRVHRSGYACRQGIQVQGTIHRYTVR
jgi:hypothetical protein